MKIFLIVAILCSSFFAAQVGIGTTIPDPKALLDLTSTQKGLLLPRMDDTQFAALNVGSVPEGLVVYNTTTKKFLGWDGTSWQNLGYEEDNTPPYFSNVDFTGTLISGQVLTSVIGSYTDAQGDLQNTPPFYAWKRADDNVGTNLVTVGSSSTYTLSALDVAKYIQFCGKARAVTGASPGTEQCTIFRGPVTAVMVNVAPTISAISNSGNLNTGSVVTGIYSYNDAESDAENTSASGSTFQWKIANDAAGTGSANATGTGNSGVTNGINKNYTLSASEVGKFVSYCVKPIANTGTTNGVETCSAYRGPITSLISGVVFNENFESGTPNNYFTYSLTGSANTGTGIVNTDSPATWSPASSPRNATVSGTQGYMLGGAASSTATATFVSPTIDATQYTNNLTLSLRLASFGTVASQGPDSNSNDFVEVEISPDNGATYYSLIKQGSNSNTNWAFSATGTNTIAYATSSPSQNTAVTGSQNNFASGVSTLTINNIPNTSTTLKVRITVQNACASTPNEFWVIDDIKLVAP